MVQWSKFPAGRLSRGYRGAGGRRRRLCRRGLLECASLKTAESALTGESLPVEKAGVEVTDGEVPLGDRKNMVFSGTFVTYGRGRFLVTGTGMDTEMGIRPC